AERVYVQINVFRRIEMAHGHVRANFVRNPIRPVASAKQGNVTASADANGRAGLVPLDRVHLPAADHRIEHPVAIRCETLTVTEWHLIIPGNNQNMGLVDSQNCLLQLAIERVHGGCPSPTKGVAEAVTTLYSD